MIPLVLAWLCSPGAAAPTAEPAPSGVRFAAADGTPLAGDFIVPRRGKPAVVLLHGVAASRAEWSGFAARLAREGVGSLAVDFRGHGQSGGPRCTTFDNTRDWEALAQDIRAAIRYLGSRGVPHERIGVIGASIGANLAAQVAAQDGRLACVALLSPGVEYRGIGVEEAALRIRRPIFLAASPGDRYAYETVRDLQGRLPQAAVSQAVAGHGAQMFADKAFTERLLEWIGANCSRK